MDRRRRRRPHPRLTAMTLTPGLAAAALFAAAFAVAADFERTIPVPRTGRATLGWTAHGCTVRSVSLANYPSPEDIHKARTSDPDDKSWVWWDFHVENRGGEKCHIALFVDVYDKTGKVVKSSDKSDTVDDHKTDDNIRVSTRMRTIDIADAPRAHIRAQIGRD